MKFQVEESQDIIYTAGEDLASIAKHLRSLIGNIPGAVFSVRIDRGRGLIRVEGAIKHWVRDDQSTEELQQEQRKSELLLTGVLKDIAEEYQLELNEYWQYNRYSLTQQQG